MFEDFYLNEDGEKVYFHEEHGSRFEGMHPDDVIPLRNLSYYSTFKKIGHYKIFLDITHSKMWNRETTRCHIVINNIIYNYSFDVLLTQNKIPDTPKINLYNSNNYSYYLKKYNRYVKYDFIKINGTNIVNSATDKIGMICNLCNHPWKPQIMKLIQGRGCPICNINNEFDVEIYNNASNKLDYFNNVHYMKAENIKIITRRREKSPITYKIEIENYIKNNNLNVVFLGFNIKDTNEWNGCNTKIVVSKNSSVYYNSTIKSLLNGSVNFKQKISILSNNTKNYFENLGYCIEKEKTFDDCVYINMLRFDYYIEELNLLIECDGKQHFTVSEMWGGDKEKELIQRRDLTKTKYALKNDYNFIRVAHFEDCKSIFDEFMDIFKIEKNKKIICIYGEFIITNKEDKAS